MSPIALGEVHEVHAVDDPHRCRQPMVGILAVHPTPITAHRAPKLCFKCPSYHHRSYARICHGYHLKLGHFLRCVCEAWAPRVFWAPFWANFHGELSGPKHVFRTALAPWCRPAPALFRISETWAIVICMPSRGAVRGVEVFFRIFQRLTIYAGKSGRRLPKS